MRVLFAVACLIGVFAFLPTVRAETCTNPPGTFVTNTGVFYKLIDVTPNYHYVSGPLTIYADLFTDGSIGETTEVLFSNPGVGLSSQEVCIPSHYGPRQVSFVDSSGIPLCQTKQYTLGIQCGTHETDAHLQVKSACLFSSSVLDPFNLMTPDHVEAERAGRVSLDFAVVSKNEACQSTAQVKVRVLNRSPFVAHNVVIELVKGNAVVAKSPKLQIPINGFVNTMLQANNMIIGKTTMIITDPENSLHGHLVNQGVSVTFTPSCDLKSNYKVDPVIIH